MSIIFNNGHLKVKEWIVKGELKVSIIKNNGHLKVKEWTVKGELLDTSRYVLNDIRMKSFQGSQNKTIKSTEINPVEDFAFTQCTSTILQFLIFV